MKKIISLALAALLVLSLVSCGDKLGKSLEKAEVGDVITMGTYEQDNNEANGKEPIEWRVLAKEDGKVLLITDKVIDCHPFNDEMKGEVSWEESTIRKWLGEEFITTAFTENEAGRILETTNKNAENRDYQIPEKADTIDRVFLLSISETTEYMGNGENSAAANEICVAYPTEYAMEKGIEVRNDGAVMWWLRETTAQFEGAACDDLGKRFYRGRAMNYPSTGVRPAMWVKIQAK